MRHKTAQYENHKPLVTDDGKEFYYRTSWCTSFKPDLNLTDDSSFKNVRDQIIDNKDYTTVSCPNEEPLIISDMTYEGS